MSFSDAGGIKRTQPEPGGRPRTDGVKDGKQVLVAEFDGMGRLAEVVPVPVPVFRPMIQITGDMEWIERELTELVRADQPVWAEVVYRGGEVAADLPERVGALTEASAVDVLRVRNQNTVIDGGANWMQPGEILGELAPEEVFLRALREQDISEERRGKLRLAFMEAVARMDGSDGDSG
jgi:hypothetical protein